MIILNDFQPLTIITKCSILDVAAVLDPPLQTHTILVNSKVFPKYDVSWNCLLVYLLSLNVGLTNLQKATW